jgi:hypothetical protein
VASHFERASDCPLGFQIWKYAGRAASSKTGRPPYSKPKLAPACSSTASTSACDWRSSHSSKLARITWRAVK